MRRLTAVGLLFGSLLCCMAAQGQSDSMIHVNQFHGTTVGDKVSTAMQHCPNGPAPCILVIDASLAAAANGTMPALCGNCQIYDFRTGGFSTTGLIAGANIPVSVLSEGAKCDGATDDTAAFQAALATGARFVTGCPNETAKITGVLSLQPSQTLDLLQGTLSAQMTGACSTGSGGVISIAAGASNNYTRVTDGIIQGASDTLGCLINISDATNDFISKWQIDHVTLIGNSATASTVGIYAHNAGVGVIRDDTIYLHLQQGVLAASGQAFNSVVFLNDTFGSPNTSTNYAADLYGCQACNFINATFEGGPLGIIFRSSQGSEIAGGWFGDGISSPTWVTIDGSSSGNKISGSFFGGLSATGTGILIQSGAQGTTVQGNTIQSVAVGIDNSGYGLEAHANEILFGAGPGINLQTAASTSDVSGNVLSSGTNSAIGISLGGVLSRIGPNKYFLSGSTPANLTCGGTQNFIVEHSSYLAANCTTGSNMVSSPDASTFRLGTNVLYRCTVAGTLPIGALTTNTASCGASGTADTGLRVK